MHADLPVDPATLGPGQLVVDLVYHPAVTPLVDAARARGAAAANGLGMLIHQAAHAIRLWTGEDPPLEVMSRRRARRIGSSELTLCGRRADDDSDIGTSEVWRVPAGVSRRVCVARRAGPVGLDQEKR